MSRVYLLLNVLFLAVLSAFGQTSRGTVTGIVTDPQSSAVPNAKVELTNLQTGVKRDTVSNVSGLYRFDAVELGDYDMTVTASGFRTFVKRKVPVAGGQVVSQDIQLEIGETKSIIRSCGGCANAAV